MEQKYLHNEKGYDIVSNKIESEEITDIMELFDVELDSYWDNHFQFIKTSKTERRKTLGKTTIDLIAINAIVPLLFHYGHTHSLESCKEKAISYLEQIDAEDNLITRNFQKRDSITECISDTSITVHVQILLQKTSMLRMQDIPYLVQVIATRHKSSHE